ncbi:hypothetical protein [Mycobacterium riyadhense]|uniref:hypothetical protein n=1 Tax=Mycobacterium riyadhense TaxID=486698 RepID=UPI00111C3A4E|nr:hypothetical protein [Mycobacterium riyadhense]MCV7147694.1 hypothetical protein [Mycobacterium riyadhense]
MSKPESTDEIVAGTALMTSMAWTCCATGRFRPPAAVYRRVLAALATRTWPVPGGEQLPLAAAFSNDSATC